MKRNKKYYTAQWGLPSDSNVSFFATSLYQAKKQANKIARQINRTNSPRTITCEGQVVESIPKGISQ